MDDCPYVNELSALFNARIAGRGWGVEPPNCFLNPLTHCQIMYRGSAIRTVYIRFTSQFCLVSDRRKIQPSQLIFHN